MRGVGCSRAIAPNESARLRGCGGAMPALAGRESFYLFGCLLFVFSLGLSLFCCYFWLLLFFLCGGVRRNAWFVEPWFCSCVLFAGCAWPCFPCALFGVFHRCGVARLVVFAFCVPRECVGTDVEILMVWCRGRCFRSVSLSVVVSGCCCTIRLFQVTIVVWKRSAEMLQRWCPEGITNSCVSCVVVV